MKIQIIIFLLNVVLVNSIFCQNIELKYELNRNTKELPPELSTMMSQFDWECGTTNQTKIFSYSITENVAKYFRDTSYFIDKNCYGQTKSKLQTDSDTFYTDFHKNEIYRSISKKTKPGEFIKYDLWKRFEPIDFIQSDTIIANIKCKKIRVKRKSNLEIYDLYYSKDIPIPGGPEFYTGMIGLIMGVKHKDFSIMAISFDKDIITIKNRIPKVESIKQL